MLLQIYRKEKTHKGYFLFNFLIYLSSFSVTLKVFIFVGKQPIACFYLLLTMS